MEGSDTPNRFRGTGKLMGRPTYPSYKPPTDGESESVIVYRVSSLALGN
jgi:hypothetical protein